MFKRVLCLLFVLLIAACNDKPAQPKLAFANTDITGLAYAQGFELRDHHGQLKTLADFRGKVVVVFFGFTHCPDVCPTTLAEMANIRQQLGAAGERLQVLFITVDPQRDTAALLADYVPAFDASFIGLRGDEAQTAQVIKDFKLYAEKVPNKSGDGYSIDHTAGSYVFDTEGRVRLFVRHGQPGAALLNDLKLLLASP
jgi:protein SCO1/2